MKGKKKAEEGRFHCDSHVNSPYANSNRVMPDSKVTIPSDDDVREAKDWVDYNEK